MQKIKELADEALALQNKDKMDSALREISALCVESKIGAMKVDEPKAEEPKHKKNGK